MTNRCGALTKGGKWCNAEAVESNEWWRCERHTDWHRNSTREERETLAKFQIEDVVKELNRTDPISQETLDTYRASGYSSR